MSLEITEMWTELIWLNSTYFTYRTIRVVDNFKNVLWIFNNTCQLHKHFMLDIFCFHSYIFISNFMIYVLFDDHLYPTSLLVLFQLIPNINENHNISNWLNFDPYLRNCVKMGSYFYLITIIMSCPKCLLPIYYIN